MTEIVNGEIYAWRVWSVYDGHLHSLVAPDRWPRGTAFVSRIDNYDGRLKEVRKDHDAPGIHAFKHLTEAAFELMQTQARLMWDTSDCSFTLGVVALWGNIIEHELGYRAQFAYPVRLLTLMPGSKDAMHLGRQAAPILMDACERAYGIASGQEFSWFADEWERNSGYGREYQEAIRMLYSEEAAIIGPTGPRVAHMLADGRDRLRGERATGYIVDDVFPQKQSRSPKKNR